MESQILLVQMSTQFTIGWRYLLKLSISLKTVGTCKPMWNLLRTTGAHFFYSSCANRSNQAVFVIWPNSFSQLSAVLKIVLIWHWNWKINTFDRQWPWRGRFRGYFAPAWASPDLSRGLLLHLSLMSAIHFSGVSDLHGYVLPWNVLGFLFALGQEVVVVVRDNGK